MLVLRGENIEKKLDKIYDRDKMRFREDYTENFKNYVFEATP